MLIAKSNRKSHILLPKMANRHGLIAGATGSGKTVTLRVIAEAASHLGIPVFMADVKGDLTGISQVGSGMVERANLLNVPFKHQGFPTIYWDLYGKTGHAIRTPIYDLGPLLLSRLMDLNRVQTGVITLAWKVFREHFPESILLDLTDLKRLLKMLADNAYDFTTEYGNITYSSVGAIQRSILELEEQEVNQFFNLPKFDVKDFLVKNTDGKGIVHLLDAKVLINRPKLYATFLLWLLSELFENLDEVGDLDQPVFIFFFDEAHLLFNDIPKILLNKVEQIIRLIRSKGVGVYFITQSPLDIPRTVLAQLGNRVQHALRAFTPEDYNAIRKIAKTFRQNPIIDTVEAITNMAIGEALVSFLQTDGTPAPVDRAWILPPQSQLKPLTDEEQLNIVKKSPYYDKYVITSKPERKHTIKSTGEQYIHDLGRSMVKTMGNQVGREFIRGVFHTFLKGVRSGVGR